jgi:hypothetical protein
VKGGYRELNQERKRISSSEFSYRFLIANPGCSSISSLSLRSKSRLLFNFELIASKPHRRGLERLDLHRNRLESIEGLDGLSRCALCPRIMHVLTSPPSSYHACQEANIASVRPRAAGLSTAACEPHAGLHSLTHTLTHTHARTHARTPTHPPTLTERSYCSL